jgi:tRNA (cytidine/uridine-2'-O-)-methyltransferase
LGFHLEDRHLRRAGLDYWEHLDLRLVNELGDVAKVVGRDRLWSFSTKASLLYTNADFRPGDGIVFGSESKGLPECWLKERPDRALRIPIRPEARCLNLANAVAIAIYEGIRQIGH